MRTVKTSQFVFAIVCLSLFIGVFALADRSDAQAQGGGPDLGMMLVEGLLATEGCLGADAGQMMSGKNIIVAWFEDKAATVRWYESNTHKGIMEGMTGGIEGYSHSPLAHVDDEDAPIMVIATITPSTDGSTLAGFPAPISQVSIELFAPLPGGAYWNGRFAPPAFEVEHIKDLSE